MCCPYREHRRRQRRQLLSAPRRRKQMPPRLPHRLFPLQTCRAIRRMGAINSAIQTRSVSLTLARLPTVNTGSWTDVAGLFARAATFFCPARRLRLRQLPCLLPREEVRQLTHTELEAVQEHRFRLIFVFRTLEEVPFARIRALMVAREQSVKATPIVVSPLALRTFRVVSYLSLEILEKLHPGLEPLALS